MTTRRMSSLWFLLSSSLALACGGTAALPVPSDATVEDASADGRDDTRIEQDASPDADAIGDVADAADASTGGDVATDVGDDGSADSGVGSDAADGDVGSVIDPAQLEQLRCEAGAPRLVWTTGGCLDTTPPTGGVQSPMPCAFVRHVDGSARCLPRIGGPVVGFATNVCSLDAVWLNAGTLPYFATTPAQVIVRVDDAAGARARHGRVLAPPGASAWFRATSTTCVASVAAYAWAVDGFTVDAHVEVDASAFVLASL